MTVVEYLVECLKNNNVTDVFGIPGGVVLEFLYELNNTAGITPHLSYHEQASAFEAIGYAQYEHKLGVAYATRGPGFTNLITGIADAYSDSIPVLFITANAGGNSDAGVRFQKDQELNTVNMVNNITKYAAVINTTDDVWKINKAIKEALSGRKGPVFLDFANSVWKQTIKRCGKSDQTIVKETNELKKIDKIREFISHSMKPLVLVGDGVRQSNTIKEFNQFVNNFKVPVISSRCGEDVGSSYSNYYGYVGSHGIRCANFIFSKADLVIVLGNRMSFPIDSKSFLQAFSNKKLIWVDVDSSELDKNIPNTLKIRSELKAFFDYINGTKITINDYSDWIEQCNKIRVILEKVDLCKTVEDIVQILNLIPEENSIVCDVGNNEFWCSQAYVYARKKNRILFSKAFGTLGNSIPKAIGEYYSSKKPVVCFVGDQGLQLNLQEIQFIASKNLPILIFVINNYSSGMIRDREEMKFSGNYLHTTLNSGYGCPNIEKIANAYGLTYKKWNDERIVEFNSPQVLELQIENDISLCPYLPVGKECQDMSPEIPRDLYNSINQM